jgi:hypothetical protein
VESDVDTEERESRGGRQGVSPCFVIGRVIG